MNVESVKKELLYDAVVNSCCWCSNRGQMYIVEASIAGTMHWIVWMIIPNMQVPAAVATTAVLDVHRTRPASK